MKFSLSFLLCCMVIASLAVNVWNNRRIAGALESQKNEIIAQMKEDEFKALNAAERKQVLERSLAAFENRKIAFAKAKSKFDKVAGKYSKLNIDDPSRVHLVNWETIAPEGGFHERFRIWVPDSPKLEVCLGFHNNDNSFVRKRTFRSSRFYQPSAPHTVPLDSGESIVELLGTRRDDSFHVELLINEKRIHEIERPIMANERIVASMMGISMRDSISVKPETRSLFYITNPDFGSATECISIQIVAPETKQERPKAK